MSNLQINFLNLRQKEKILEMADEFSQTISQCIQNFSGEKEVLISEQDEECEREVAKEEEAENEREVQLTELRPHCESIWDYSQVANITTVGQLASLVNVEALSSAIQSRVCIENIMSIKWLGANVFGTSNFFTTTQKGQDPTNCLRQCDAMLVFNKPNLVVLLSDREADAVLQVIGKRTGPGFSYVNFSRVKQARKQNQARISLSIGAASLTWSPLTMLEDTLAMLQLFNGETMYDTEYRRKQVELILEQRNARQAQTELILARGKSRHIFHSDFDAICKFQKIESAIFEGLNSQILTVN
jgi:hypothetical protein